MIFTDEMFKASPPIFFNDFVLKRVAEHKHLGIWLTPTLSWSRHLHHICMRANSKLSVLRNIRYLSRPVLDILYKQQIRSVIDYVLVLFYGSLNQSDIASWTESSAGVHVVRGALHLTSRIKLDNDLGWESLADKNCWDFHFFIELHTTIWRYHLHIKEYQQFDVQAEGWPQLSKC